VSLGCTKNLVDSEVMLGRLKEYEITDDNTEADVIIVNTCGFINPAVEESIGAILEAAEYKTQGKCRRLIVTGCLVNRYRKEIRHEVPEIDAVVDTFSLEEIRRAVEGAEEEKPRINSERILLTPPHYAYLKIADGCNHRCSFCAIPLIKGDRVSRTVDSLLAEAKVLARRGVKELILISQDSTSWGLDLPDKPKLSNLLSRLAEETDFPWIRLMYLYPKKIDDSLIEVIAKYKNILPYFDLPLQHVNADILKNMGRGGSGVEFLTLIGKIREAIPDAVFRTSMIVGFPGESDATIAEMVQFLKDAELENVGVFTYWHEEGTPAYEKFEDKATKAEKNRWRRKVMSAQRKISHKRLEKIVGTKIDVIIDGEHPESELLLSGRYYGQAPEIDGNIIITEGHVNRGDIVSVHIDEAFDYDLSGKVI
ncbi:MAG: 30S ribosomal protein S12 methylthiotransferase RimO, partial [Acidobacteria bacterium]|nr:30S ribosomal protein S12 methylthiotransferase RimO [Acidobacteriota bacterium]